jgi:hypothetical protein
MSRTTLRSPEVMSRALALLADRFGDTTFTVADIRARLPLDPELAALFDGACRVRRGELRCLHAWHMESPYVRAELLDGRQLRCAVGGAPECRRYYVERESRAEVCA